MPQTFIHRDFSAGWCPSDDIINGRPNGMLRMECCELDTNGALVMTGGIKTLLGPGFGSSNAHSIYTKFLASSQHNYVSCVNGTTYRDAVSIQTGGSATRSGFGAYADFVIIMSDTKRIRDTGAATANLGQTKDSVGPTLGVAGGAGNLTGTIEYLQVNVYNGNGAYLARSSPGVITSVALTAQNATVTGHNPTAPANETWFFRRGATLDQFYRVKVLTSGYTTVFTDSLTDLDALAVGITLNLTALSVNSTDLPDPVLEVVGPINNRMLYFTKSTIYPSEINSPESYVPGAGIFICGSSSAAELFLWAKKVNNNTILVGTTHDIYVLTGTWITLPDGSYDIYYRSLGCKFPPLGIDADIYNGGVIYMANDGPRITYPDGSSESFADERIDRLYRGETPYTNALGIPIYIFPQYRYCIAAARNKIWLRMPAIAGNNPATTFTSTFHVYDIKRKYWRLLTNVPDILTAQEDGAVVGFWNSNFSVREINNQFQKLDDVSNQTITVQFPAFDFGSPTSRHDFYAIKLLCKTGGSNLTIKYSIDGGVTFTTLSTVSTTNLAEKFLDMSAITPSNNIIIQLTGALADFLLSRLAIEYDTRPSPTTYVYVPRFDMGQALDGHKFRPRTWPIIIDTLGNNVTFTPVINGADQTTSTFNSSVKKALLHFFAADSPIPTDLGFKLSSSFLFEFYHALAPELVHVFPMAKRFDQLGPVEIFKYGKIKSIRVRLYSDSTANIPYAIYFQDASVTTGNIAAIANVEDTYEFMLPKTIGGTILRIELGPTSFNFYRYYMQLQVAASGRDTDLMWITLPEQTS